MVGKNPRVHQINPENNMKRNKHLFLDFELTNSLKTSSMRIAEQRRNRPVFFVVEESATRGKREIDVRDREQRRAYRLKAEYSAGIATKRLRGTRRERGRREGGRE